MTIILCVCFCFLLVGCEGETEVRCAHISEATSALSTNYAIKVVLDNDDRMQEKYVDLQVRSSKEGQILTFGEENFDDFTVVLQKADYWYNLTYLVSQANGTNTENGYQTYKDFGNKMYRFSADNDVDLTFRVVAGKTKKNEETQEEILVLSEDISDEVTVKLKKNNQN